MLEGTARDRDGLANDANLRQTTIEFVHAGRSECGPTSTLVAAFTPALSWDRSSEYSFKTFRK